MRRQVVTGIVPLIVAAVVTVSPLTAMAQASGLDDQTRASVVAMAHQVGHTIAPTVIAENSGEILGGGAPNPAQEDSATEPNQTNQTPGQPNPQIEGSQSEPNKGADNLPALNLSDLAKYSNQGVTIKAPADWTVKTDTDDGTPFQIDVPGTDLIISLTSDSSLDFPSWLGLALFRSQPDFLVKEFSKGAQVDESSTFYTDQGLPVVKLSFSSTEDGTPVGGALYTLAPNTSAYVLTVAGSADNWQYAAPGFDLLAKSITFDPDLITSVKIGDKPEEFSDEDKTVQVTVPAGWYASSTGDKQFPIILAEPEVRYVVAIGTDKSLGGDFDPKIIKQFEDKDGNIDPAKYPDVLHALADSMGNSGSAMKLDEEASQIIPRDGATLIKLAGDADLGNDMSIPVIIYVDIRGDEAAAAAVFGDIDSAKEKDADLQTMIASIKKLGE